jgi:long-chain acyl-CoA synthetase
VDSRQKEKASRNRATDCGCGWRMRGVSAIRKKMVGENLKALICGSAPLTPETQDYFSMLGIPVLQVYGLTETTGHLYDGRSSECRAGPCRACDSRH